MAGGITNAEIRRRVVKQAQGTMSAMIAAQAAASFAEAVKLQEKEVNKLLKFLGEAIGAGAIPPGLIERTHQDVANMVGRSIVQAYTHRRHRRSVESYRINDRQRYAGNKMLRALQDPSNYVGTVEGIELLNRAVLDNQAAQWWRLNFGAGGLGGSTNNPQTFPVSWSGLLLFSIGFTGETSSSFRLPKGVFIGGEGGRARHGENPAGTDRFYFIGGSAPPGGFGPGGIPRSRPTRGIAANNFLDAGARRLAVELPRAYLGMYDQLLASKRLGQVQATVTVPAPLRRQPQRIGNRFL